MFDKIQEGVYDRRAMDAFELAALIERCWQSDQLYYEFLRVPNLSVGIYQLPAAGRDPQQPHAEDEVYFVLAGRAVLRVGEEDRPVQPGSILYVPALLEPAFHSVVEPLTVLVFFAPAESQVA